jgi:recA bacterial DNA recombination protein
MSTLATNTSLAQFFPVGSPDKKTAAMKYIAQSERLVAVRPASRLEVRPKPKMISTGIAELDALTGGIPRGCLTEICGTLSSGKTSVLLATIASATRREESCVLIDASDSFDPTAGAAAGLEFNKLLWIRCAGQLSRKTRARTPVSPNFNFVEARAPSPSHKLEQVLKSTDLILQSGGFGLVALDLAGIPEKFVRRIPLVSWFRFQRAVEHTKTALLVISENPCAQTCAALLIKVFSKTSHSPGGADELSPALQRWGNAENTPSPVGTAEVSHPSHAQVLKKMHLEAEILCSRLEHKPMQSAKAAFSTQAVRAG